MELDDLKKQLVSAGWQISASEFLSGSDWYAWLSREARQTKSNCNCNSKPPSFCIEPSSFFAGGKTHSMATFRLCGELPTERWVDFRVYSVPLDEVIPAIDDAKSALFAAWEAAFSASPQSVKAVELRAQVKHGSIALARELCVQIAGYADDDQDPYGNDYGSVDIAEILSAEVVRLRDELKEARAAAVQKFAGLTNDELQALGRSGSNVRK